MRISLAFLASIIFAFPALASSERYSSDEIRSGIIGRQIFLQTPFGGEFPLNYRLSGGVDGSGEALGLGRFVKPNDKGRWWIDSDRLCQKFRNWYDGKPMCFELYHVKDGQLKWIRNDGETGLARIGSQL